MIEVCVSHYYQSPLLLLFFFQFVNSGSNIEHLVAAIRVAAQWYQTHLGGAARVLLITNDRDNKRKAIEEGISAETSM